ncbi:MAG: hypothetical protein JW866_11150 [Ignavibacteriales bacterium]|nr:hypothetical protein [Ignavibacteriales bacterium]
MKNLINKNLLNMLMFLLLALLLLSNCCEEITEPKPIEPDTTTQDFEFEEYLFGDGYSSSYVNGAWIFSENNIWAVGWFHGLTNIIRWNGTNWYEVNEFQGTSSGIYDIWALDSNTVYFVTGGIYKYKNGTYTRQVITNLPPQGMILTDIWTSSENNVWAVGEWGAIAHYDGVSWKKVEFDTLVHFYGITGDPSTGIGYAIGRKISYDQNCYIVELKDSARIIYDNQKSIERLQVGYNIDWLGNNELIISFSEIWTFNISTKLTEVQYDLPIGYGSRGTGIVGRNDMYFWYGNLDHERFIYHYNGSQYKRMQLEKNGIWMENGHAIKDLAVFTGSYNNKAYLLKITRSKK